MARARLNVLLIALIATVLVGLSLLSRHDWFSRDQGDDSSYQTSAPEDVAEPVNADAHVNPTTNAPDPGLISEVGVPDCISLDQFEADPLMAAEYERFDSLVTSGPTIESYRGLTSADLAELANQRDSAAMAVLGAISVMRARNLSDDAAVVYLLRDEQDLWPNSLPEPLEPDTVAHLEEARDWFYKSALHGRLLALQNAGEIIAVVGGSPIELGWIQQDEYDLLEPYERHALDPINVYGALAIEIAPELRSGLLGTMISELTPGGERQQSVLQELARQFNQDREAAGLPPVEIPASTTPSMEELETLLCEP